LIANLTTVFWEVVLEEHEKGQDLKVAELKDAIQAGIESGPGVPAQEVFESSGEKVRNYGEEQERLMRPTFVRRLLGSSARAEDICPRRGVLCR
jgi:hypothetical protein